MQNQKTSPKKTDFSEPRALSVQEQRLVEALGQGANNVEAYRAGYGAEGYSPAALRVKACRKVAEAHIQQHLDALRAVGLAKAGLTIESRIEDELAFAKRAELAGNFGAAGGAYDRVNKLMGAYVEKYEDVGKSDPLKALKELEQIDPDYARKLAASHNVEWHSDEPSPTAH